MSSILWLFSGLEDNSSFLVHLLSRFIASLVILQYLYLIVDSAEKCVHISGLDDKEL